MSFFVHIQVQAQIVATLVGIVPKAVATGVVSKDRNAVATSATSAPTVADAPATAPLRRVWR
jgi:hypothetical protein